MSKSCAYLTCLLSVFLAPHLIALPLPNTDGDSADSLDFYPLSVGNSWTYVAYWGFPDTTYKVQSSIVDTARVDGKLYYLHSGPTLGYIGMTSLPVDTLRSDSIYRIWRFEKAKEYMLFDFYHGNYPSFTTYPELDTVRVTYNVEIAVPAGHFSKCVDLYFQRSFGDESIGYVFAPGVGIVRFYGPFYGTHNLLRALLNGKLISSVGTPNVGAPSAFILEQNYPNPFNPSTTIRYGLPHKLQVSLIVYNTLGQLVSQLVSGEQEAGYHEVRFVGSGLASGVYFYRLQAGDFAQTRKLLMLR